MFLPACFSIGWHLAPVLTYYFFNTVHKDTHETRFTKLSSQSSKDTGLSVFEVNVLGVLIAMHLLVYF